MTISGIPTTRVSDLFIRDRLLNQVQTDQIDLYNIQMQLSTGHRFQLPSEDPVSAMQVISLQRLLERKQQVQTNLQTNQSFLTMTDSALSGVSNLASEARGVALSVIGTTASDTEREAAAQQIEQIIKQMYDTADQKFRGRYLFAGSSTMTSPFQTVGAGYIEYVGNEQRLSSYADTDLLFDTNLTGSEVFGAISTAVTGTNLHPALTFATRLADLRGGQGIDLGSIELSDGTSIVNVDLSSADTIGDVAGIIRSEGARLSDEEWVTVDVTPRGLVVELHNIDGSAAKPLMIRDVVGGVTASELGIRHEDPTTAKIVGEPLDPILRATTKVENFLGARSVAFLHSVGSDNDLIVRADRNGEMNDIAVVVLDDPAVSAGNEQVELVDGTLTIRIEEGQTTAEDVIAAFEKYYDPATMPFTAELDPQDAAQGGTGLVGVTDAADPVLTEYGWGEDLDTEHGLEIVNGNQQVTVRLNNVQTVEDLLSAVNGEKAGLLAEINSSGTGVNIRSRYSGADFSIGENGGQTATQLGLRSFTSETRLEDLNFGRGVADYEMVGAEGDDFSITLKNGEVIQVDLNGAKNIQDVIDVINDNLANDPDLPLDERPLEARLAGYGNGIELVDRTTGSGTLTVTRATLSTAAIDLGLIPEGSQSCSAVATSGPEPEILTGRDVNPLETEGMFTALVRLQHALQTNDNAEAERAMGLLDDAVETLNFSRAELGARQQGLEALSSRLDTEETDLTEVLSVQYDADFAEVASSLAGRQVAYQASLQVTAQILRISLLDYL